MNSLLACFRQICCCIPPDPNLPVAQVNKNQQANTITFSINFVHQPSQESNLSICDISISNDKTVLELKELIYEKVGIPIDQQEIKLPDDPNITHDAKTLDDTTKLIELPLLELIVFVRTTS